MAVNAEQQKTLLFVHVPKTAGTTLRVVMEQQYIGQPIFLIQHDIQAERKRLAALGEQEKRHLRAVYGHQAWGWHEHLANDQPHAYITMLRDPVERVLSLWAHCQLKEHYLGPSVKGMDLVAFLTSGVTQTPDNGMVRQLCGRDEFLQKPGRDMAIPHGGVTQADLESAKANLRSCAVVGIAEQFDAFLGIMRQRFGWRINGYQNVNVTLWPRLHVRDLDRRTLAAMEQSTALDWELYRLAVELSGGQ